MSTADEIAKLHDLLARGAITPEEFERQKARLLAEPTAQDWAINRMRLSNDDKWIAGVCGGIAEETGVESWIWRLIMVAGLFAGGATLVVYLLLWIMAPEKPGADGKLAAASGLLLSRADRKIAGVCGGLGEWLDVDPVFFRVTFILFALVCGLGIVVYVLLWIFLPRAATPMASG